MLARRLLVGIDEVGRAASKASLARTKYIVGIDEVGRGPLAGPVVVAAIMMPSDGIKKIAGLPPLRDSKKLSEKQREEWFRYLKEIKAQYAVARVSPKVIDRINIAKAANLAASRALLRLIATYYLPVSRLRIVLDGGLFLLPDVARKCGSVRTVVRGDERIPIISLASIVAKVTRDRYMKRLDRRFPQFGFAEHKGYGTRSHYRALKRQGSSPIHRLTFIKSF